MALQDDIKKLIESQGKESLRSITFANILADTSREYSDTPAIKRILREILSSGIGGRLLDLDDADKQIREVKSKTLAADFAIRTGFKEDTVSYIFDCLKYALGWIDTVTEVSVDSYQEYSTPIPDTSKKKQLDLNKMLNSLKIDYVNSLASFYTYPVKGFFTSKQGYFSSENASKLLLMEQKIEVVGQSLNIDLSKWCAEQKEIFEANNRIPDSAIKQQFMTKIVAPICLCVMGSGVVSFNYAASNAKEKFISAVAIADKTYTDGDCNKAFAGYIAAKSNYDGLLSSSDELNNANAKIEKLLSAQEDALTAEGKYKDAINWLQGLKDVSKSDKETLNLIDNHITSLNARQESEIETGLPKLIENISRNRGKMTKDGKELLKKLLVISPDDYWLNILASKELK